MDEIIENLIKFGKDNHKISDSTLNKLKSLGCNAHIIADHVESLTDIDLINLFKGIVLFELKYAKIVMGDCGYGSTTPVPSIYGVIEKRGIDKDWLLANWAFQISENPYVPFGMRNRLGAKNAHEYKRLLSLREKEMQRHQVLLEEQIHVSKKYRKISKQLKIKMHDNKIKYEREISYIFSLLTPNEQIKFILSNESHNIYFFMPLIEKLLLQDNINDALWMKVKEKIETYRDTKYKRKIIKQIDIHLSKNKDRYDDKSENIIKAD